MTSAAPRKFVRWLAGVQLAAGKAAGSPRTGGTRATDNAAFYAWRDKAITLHESMQLTERLHFARGADKHRQALRWHDATREQDMAVARVTVAVGRGDRQRGKVGDDRASFDAVVGEMPVDGRRVGDRVIGDAQRMQASRRMTVHPRQPQRIANVGAAAKE